MRYLILLLACPLYGQTPEHKFYDKPAKIELAAEIGSATADMAMSCRNVHNGGVERQIPTQSCLGMIAYTAGTRVGVEGVAYLLHKTRHHKLEKIPRVVATALSLQGIGYSIKHGGTQ